MNEAENKTSANKLKFLRDSPIESKEEDKFAHYSYVEAIESILRNSDNPIHIGLFGSWGLGKSSILNMLREKFADEDDFTVIIIDAWKLSIRYLKEEFLLEINRNLGTYTDKELYDRLIHTQEEKSKLDEKKKWRSKLKLTLTIVLLASSLISFIVNYYKNDPTIANNPIFNSTFFSAPIAFLLLLGGIAFFITMQVVYGQGQVNNSTVGKPYSYRNALINKILNSTCTEKRLVIGAEKPTSVLYLSTIEKIFKNCIAEGSIK